MFADYRHIWRTKFSKLMKKNRLLRTVRKNCSFSYDIHDNTGETSRENGTGKCRSAEWISSWKRHFPFTSNSPVVYRLARGRKRVIRMPWWNLMRVKVEIRGNELSALCTEFIVLSLGRTPGFEQCGRQLYEKKATKAEMLSKPYQGWD